MTRTSPAPVVADQAIAGPPTSPAFRSETSRLVRSSYLSRLPKHLLPSLFLVGAAAFTFHETLFFGYRLIGNSDRLNHYLTFILFHTHNLERGQFAAWSDFIYDGFDSLSLPMSFFTPLYAIPALLHTDDVVSIFGFIAFVLLAVTLLEAYFVVYLFTHDRLASLAGACTYAGATYGLLKLVQSDQTYLSVLTAPAFFYLIYTTGRHNWIRRFVVLTLLVTIEFYFAFLQEFSYNVIFFFVYAGYLLLRRNWYPLLTFGFALGAGAVLSLPRLLAQYANVADSGRGRGEPVLQDTVDLRTLLRFFSRDIFGHSLSDQDRLPVQINLHEGDLVHASVFGALLLLLIVLSCRWIFQVRQNRTPIMARYNAIVLVVYVLFVFAVMHIPSVYLLFARLYQNISFQHSRIGVSALLPIALLTGLYLAQGRSRLGRTGALVALTASLVVVAVSGFDFSTMPDHIRSHFGLSLPFYVSCDHCPPRIDTGPLLTWDVLRFLALAGLFAVVLVAGTVCGARGRSVMKTVLAVAIVFQTVWGAADYIEGPQTRSYTIPYETNDFVTARSDQFIPPTPNQLDQMHTLLDNNNYRSVTICPPHYPNCSTMMGMTWGIRLMDGYSSGVPRRLSVLGKLPAELHDIRYDTVDDVRQSLRTQSFLNVRQAIQIDPTLYMNSGLQVPDGVHVIPNPSPYIYPRAFFASTTQATDARGAEQAVGDELNSCSGACDGLLHQRFPIDFVEGGISGTYDASGDLAWSGGGDRMTFDFPSSQQQRFLVVNEMWAAGWTASVDGRQVPVEPTNVAMRGVLVPAGATQVVLAYHSLLQWAWWYTPGVALLFGIALFALARRTSRARTETIAHF